MPFVLFLASLSVWSPSTIINASPGDSVMLDCRYAAVVNTRQLTVNWFKHHVDETSFVKTHIWKYIGETGFDRYVGDYTPFYTHPTTLPIREGHQIILTNAQNATRYECQVEYGSDSGKTSIHLFVHKGREIM